MAAVRDGTLKWVVKSVREMTFVELEDSVQDVDVALKALQLTLQMRASQYEGKIGEFVLSVADGEIS
jgi:hypothetical protein